MQGRQGTFALKSVQDDALSGGEHCRKSFIRSIQGCKSLDANTSPLHSLNLKPRPARERPGAFCYVQRPQLLQVTRAAPFVVLLVPANSYRKDDGVIPSRIHNIVGVLCFAVRGLVHLQTHLRHIAKISLAIDLILPVVRASAAPGEHAARAGPPSRLFRIVWRSRFPTSLRLAFTYRARRFSCFVWG